MVYQNLRLLSILLLASLYSQVLGATTKLTPLTRCEITHANAQCFELATSEGTENPGVEVRLPVHYLPALDTKLSEAPVVWLNGGPGISNMDPPLPEWIFKYFDVLVIGYRGVDGTPKLDCPNLKNQFKSVQSNNHVDLLSEEAFQLFRGEVRDCQNYWESRGYNTGSYSTLHVVNDIELVRQELDIPRISMLSASYGTRVAWYYDQMYPDRLFRNVLLSGNPTGGFYFDPATIDSQIKLLSQWCASDAQCQEHTPNLYESIKTVLSNLPETTWGVHIDPDHLRIATFMLLYSKNTWPLLADAFGKADRGNTSGLAAMLKFPNPMTGNDWIWGAFFSAGSIDYDPLHDYAPNLTKAVKQNGLGSPLSELIFEGLSAGWEPQRVLPPVKRISTTPTIILGSEVDVATPIERIESEWLPWLPNGVLISVEGAGHAPDHISAGGEALSSHLKSFLAGGEAKPESDFGMPIQWKPKFSLTWFVYLFWGAIGLIAAGLIYGLIILSIRILK